jgi:hypothetical protein
MAISGSVLPAHMGRIRAGQRRRPGDAGGGRIMDALEQRTVTKVGHPLPHPDERATEAAL